MATWTASALAARVVACTFCACTPAAPTRSAALESSTAWAGLDVRPTGFTSLLTIEW